MALLHNSIFRGYNSIYLQAPHVQDADKADFIGYALTWYKFVKSHHDDEEQSLFTKVEDMLDDKTIFEETHKEHESFLPGLAEFNQYLLSVQPNPQTLDPAELIRIMDGFHVNFETHFHNEIGTLSRLASHPNAPAPDTPEAAEAFNTFKTWGKSTVTKAGTTDVVPFFLLNLDRTDQFEEGMWANWPPIPAPIKWGLINIGGWMNGNYWKFSSCDSAGNRRELYALQGVEPKARQETVRMDMSMGDMTMHVSSTTMSTSTTAMHVMPLPPTTTATATGNMAMENALGSMHSMSMRNMMLWNWNTIGSCFITPQWQIGTKGGMVGTCSGVVFLVAALEMLRRATKEFDRCIVRRQNRKQSGIAPTATSPAPGARSQQDSPADDHSSGQDSAAITVEGGMDGAESRKSSSPAAGSDGAGAAGVSGGSGGGDAAVSVGQQEEEKAGQVALGGDMSNRRAPPCRPNIWQQGLRALLHTAQFTVAYIIMLLAMTYNGYIIMSIIIGAYLGSFIFSWETLSYGTRSNTSAGDEATVCCS
ncbi:hypothetical protein VSDG_03069 [Cytospora chrysosperma]|uniref:Hemerythrin-like domain-containing protein n=1 Tax=Cytospora chrysosperma TaxID=252740 RepID=A0A423W961_CYTCH|nr:hypothetical protein VSDG_03069 [Valsa sordida]